MTETDWLGMPFKSVCVSVGNYKRLCNISGDSLADYIEILWKDGRHRGMTMRYAPFGLLMCCIVCRKSSFIANNVVRILLSCCITTRPGFAIASASRWPAKELESRQRDYKLSFKIYRL